MTSIQPLMIKKKKVLGIPQLHLQRPNGVVSAARINMVPLKNATLPIPQLLPQRPDDKRCTRYEENTCADEHDLDHVEDDFKAGHG